MNFPLCLTIVSIETNREGFRDATHIAYLSIIKTVFVSGSHKKNSGKEKGSEYQSLSCIVRGFLSDQFLQ